MERLIKTLHLANGELFCSQQANRYTLAHCEPVPEIYEKSASVPVLGAGPASREHTLRQCTACRPFGANVQNMCKNVQPPRKWKIPR